MMPDRPAPSPAWPAATGIAAALLALAIAPPPARAADIRAAAAAECRPTERPLVHDCTILLTDRRTGEPLDDVSLTVGAQMPSTPMAHNVRPVRASPGDGPGHYVVTLELEMHGVWALQLDLAGPLRDRVVATLDFQPGMPASSAPAGR